jgi:uncharacterized coiled-coil protein SlyX
MNNEMRAAALFGETVMFRVELVPVEAEAKFHFEYDWEYGNATQSEISPARLSAESRAKFGMADEYSRRMDKLEANLAHLEHQVEQLNGVVIEQDKLLERLKKEVQRQSRSMETLELERIQSNNAKPPHYQ